MKWVTRERPKTDRIACPWLIRTFIDPDAEFLYVPANQVLEIAEREGARSYDAPGATYTHRDGLCSFEVLVEDYAIDDPALRLLARIVHGADVSDDRDAPPQSRGLLAIAEGFHLLQLEDHRQLELSLPVYDALYAWCRNEVAAGQGHRRVRPAADARRILLVQALRAFAYGLGSVLIGVTLADLGLSGVQVGLVLGALVAGTALVSIALARSGERIGRRRCYVGLLGVMAVAGTVFALTGSVWLLVLAALTGTVSTEVVESGPFTSLEQAMLPSAAEGHDTTRLFGTYNTIATLAGSFGALAAIATRLIDVEPQRFLLAYPAVAAGAIVVAARLGARVESRSTAPAERRSPLDRSRGIVVRLSGLFALDSFGGGFVTQAFLAYWFTEKWGTSTATLGVVFFAVGFLQAGSFQVAVRLAGRIGLLNTMVFTHLPSNLLLALVPFAPTQSAAIALVLGRFALSQMDVPTRQAYVVAVVDPEERVAAAAYTNAARYIVRPLGPLVAGPILAVSLGAPFVIAGALKSVYDLGLYVLFRHVRLSDGEP